MRVYGIKAGDEVQSVRQADRDALGQNQHTQIHTLQTNKKKIGAHKK